jgi:hypothetical protein
MLPLFPLLAANTAVTSLLGLNPVRLYPFGQAPENSPRPYATYGVYNGIPENYVTNTPDIDNAGTQIDVWAKDAASCMAVFNAIRDCLEPHAHMTSFRYAERDYDTQLYHAVLEFDFWVNR